MFLKVIETGGYIKYGFILLSPHSFPVKSIKFRHIFGFGPISFKVKGEGVFYAGVYLFN
jgi:hypothetical protein